MPDARVTAQELGSSFQAPSNWGCWGHDDESGALHPLTPIHVLAITAMGIQLLDYVQFEDLRAACERGGRWEFLFVAGPLRITGGTGSPLNPVAVL